jgi:high-affinity nickel-transport protein
MEAAFLPSSGLWLMFLLGLRHGFDPDHIAMIDSMTYRVFPEQPCLAAWIGTLFALGHGLAVTAIAVALGAWVSGITLSPAVHLVLDWLPTLLLIVVGTLNLRELLGSSAYQPRGWKTQLLPRRLRNSSHPLAIVLIGVLFALVFDTATQAAAWGYAAASSAGAMAALLAGLTFTAGMVLTDTLDGRLVVRLLRQTAGRGGAAGYRRRIGWIVVVISFAMASYEIAMQLVPGLAFGDLSLTMLGSALFLTMALAYAFTCWRLRHTTVQTSKRA